VLDADDCALVDDDEEDPLELADEDAAEVELELEPSEDVVGTELVELLDEVVVSLPT
jgi:hypothetical protein